MSHLPVRSSVVALFAASFLALAPLSGTALAQSVTENALPLPDTASDKAVDKGKGTDMAATSPWAAKAPLDLSISEQQQAMANGSLTSVELVTAYLQRIDAIDRNGPQLRSIIATMPDALDQARRLDAMRAKGEILGPLHGIAIIIKDNIEAKGPVATTAGSTALLHNITDRDADLVARLKAAGAVIIAKANLSQWANMRSLHSASGWSSIGGLVKNPHMLDRTACGSSSGSAAAIAASLASGAIGTETDGSITCPAAINGIIGLKPSMGLVSRRHIVPLSHRQDIAGPMARTVRDTALILTAIAGSDRQDPVTAKADSHKRDYAARLDQFDLKGARIGVLRDRFGDNPHIARAFDELAEQLQQAGAILVDIADSKAGLDNLGASEFDLLQRELKADIATYLQGLPMAVQDRVRARNLADLIAWNKAHEDTEMPWFKQEIFVLAEAQGDNPHDDPAYREAAENITKMAREKLDSLMRDENVAFLIGPSNAPAWPSDLLNGDNFAGPSQSRLPAISGYPHLTLPMGVSRGGLPLGLSIIGPLWADEKLLQLGYAIEQLRGGADARPQLAYREGLDPTQ